VRGYSCRQRAAGVEKVRRALFGKNLKALEEAQATVSDVIRRRVSLFAGRATDGSRSRTPAWRHARADAAAGLRYCR
jgi:hypothetical protein